MDAIFKKIVSVAIVGRYNDLLFFYSDEDNTESINLQMITNSALDVIDEKKHRSSNQTSIFDTYLGQLYLFDDYKIYGSCSNTNFKIIIVCESSTPDNAVRELFGTITSLHHSAILNPFQSVGQPLTSKTLYGKIRSAVNKINSKLV